MKPVPMNKKDLVATLRNMADLVDRDDSFEGSIGYSMPMPEDEPVPTGTYAMVMASYRIGNSMGQGGLRMIGAMETSE